MLSWSAAQTDYRRDNAYGHKREYERKR